MTKIFFHMTKCSFLLTQFADHLLHSTELLDEEPSCPVKIMKTLTLNWDITEKSWYFIKYFDALSHP